MEKSVNSYGHENIVSKWKDDFLELFKDRTQLKEASDDFLENIREIVKDWEDQMKNMTTETNETVN